MRYKARPGVVYTKICGTGLLIPSRAVFDDCKSIEVLSFIKDAAWRSLVNGNPVENLIRAYQILTKCSEAEATAYFTDFCNGLCEKGFLLPDKEP